MEPFAEKLEISRLSFACLGQKSIIVILSESARRVDFRSDKLL